MTLTYVRPSFVNASRSGRQLYSRLNEPHPPVAAFDDEPSLLPGVERDEPLAVGRVDPEGHRLSHRHLARSTPRPCLKTPKRTPTSVRLAPHSASSRPKPTHKSTISGGSETRSSARSEAEHRVVSGDSRLLFCLNHADSLLRSVA